MECDTSQSQQPQGQENKKLNARKMIEKYYHQLTKVLYYYLKGRSKTFPLHFFDKTNLKFIRYIFFSAILIGSAL